MMQVKLGTEQSETEKSAVDASEKKWKDSRKEGSKEKTTEDI